MKNLIGNCVRDILLAFLLVTICAADASDDGFLNVTCREASDCYVLDNVNDGLWLACWYNVNKCKCQNTISSNFNLKWENKQCLMSKYGPCGAKGELAVGCQDGFVCVENQCRDPKDTSTRSVKVTPFVFENSKCSDGHCSFSDDLDLRCDYESDRCACGKVYIADGRDNFWDIRNYAGNNNCSVGKFGPCGNRNGVQIDCHGDGITCISGTCLDANHMYSDIGEGCESKKNCKEGLLCSLESVCIEPHSLPENKICNNDDECQRGLKCSRNPSHGPWSFAYCQKMTTNNVHQRF